jgi:hypothetical protein
MDLGNGVGVEVPFPTSGGMRRATCAHPVQTLSD